MATADIAAASLTDIEHRGQLRRAVIASTVGTTIECAISWCTADGGAGLWQVVFSEIRSADRYIGGVCVARAFRPAAALGTGSLA
jgi:hypothetical protein